MAPSRPADKSSTLQNGPAHRWLRHSRRRGLVPDDHPNAGGVLGRSGTPIASWFMNEADLLIVFGASFANHTGIERSKPIIQVDYDRMQLGKFHPVDIPVWGEIGAFCTAVAPDIKRNSDAPDQISELAERWQKWRVEKQRRLDEEHATASIPSPCLMRWVNSLPTTRSLPSMSATTPIPLVVIWKPKGYSVC